MSEGPKKATIEDHADQCAVEFITNWTKLPLDGKAHKALREAFMDFYERVKEDPAKEGEDEGL